MTYQGKEIVQPPFLSAGDKVALVSPAYWIPQEAVEQAADTIRSWGLEPVIGPHTNSLNVKAYAGTAEERAADLLWAFQDDSIKAIVCSRGGYGSIHLMKLLTQDIFRLHPKWLIGHGDITMLLYYAATAGVPCVHGPMAFQIAANVEPDVTLLRNILFGTHPQYQLPAHANNHCGHAQGILMGGNLSSFAVITGTSICPVVEQDVILFIEEVEEPLHNIDRLFYMLSLQSNFHHVKGVILGSFNSIRYDLEFDSVEQMLTEHLRHLDIPICCGFPTGSNSCTPLIAGAPCTLDVTSDGSRIAFDLAGGTVLPHVIEQSSQPMYR